MDSNNVNIPISVQTTGVTTEVDKLKQKIGELTSESKKFNDESSKVETLKTQFRNARVEVQKLSEMYGETSIQAAMAAKNAAKLRDSIEDSDKLIQTFNPDQKFIALQGALKGVVGGFELITGAQALFGEKSKEVEEALLKVQAAMALSRSIDDISEARKAFINLGTQIKATTIFQEAYNFVMGTRSVVTSQATIATEVNTVATGEQAAVTVAATTATTASTTAMKLFRLALISTGIGALVVGIGLLIANFDSVVKWVKSAVDWFGSLSGTVKNVISVLFPLIGVIRLVNYALEQMGVIDTDAEAEMKKNAEEKMARDRKAAVSLQEKQDKVGKYYDFEIAKAQAAGKDTYELEQQKQLAILETARAYYKSMEAIVKNGKATKEELDSWKKNVELIESSKQTIELNNIKHKKYLDDEKKKGQKKEVKTEKKHLKSLADLNKETDELIARNRLESIKDTNTKKQLELEAALEKETDAQIDKYNKGEISKTQYEKRIFLIESYYAGKRQELSNDIAKQRADAETKINETILNNSQFQLSEVTKNQNEIEIQRQNEIDSVNEQLNLGVINVEKADQAKLAINANYNSQQTALLAQYNLDNQKLIIDNNIKEDEQLKNKILQQGFITQAGFSELLALQAKYNDDKVAEENNKHAEALLSLQGNNVAIEEENRRHKAELVNIEQENADETVAIKQILADQQEQIQERLNNLGSQAIEIIGKNTAAGKAIAVAQATINTLKSAVQIFAADMPGPPPVALAIKIASMAAAIAAGYKTVKSIVSTKVPSGGGGGGGAPSMPSISQVKSFAAPQIFGIGGQKIKDVQQLKDQKVVVVESDITRVQNRVSQVRAASIHGG